MATLKLELAERSYPIHIDSKLLNKGDLLSSYIRAQRVCIVTNTQVAPLYLDKIKNQLADFQLDEVILPDGEAEKISLILKRSCHICWRIPMVEIPR